LAVMLFMPKSEMFIKLFMPKSEMVVVIYAKF
jgi:hypothetical protein